MISRRAFLAAAGWGTAIASLLWWEFGSGEGVDPVPSADKQSYTDYEGWVVTPQEKQQLEGDAN